MRPFTATIVGALVILAGGQASHAQALVSDLAAFKAIPTPAGVTCTSREGEHECEATVSVEGKQYAFFVGFIEDPHEGQLRRGFAMGVAPRSAAGVAAFKTYFAHYAGVLALNDKQPLASLASTFEALADRCKASPKAVIEQEKCQVAEGDTIIRALGGADDNSGVVFIREWFAKP